MRLFAVPITTVLNCVRSSFIAKVIVLVKIHSDFVNVLVNHTYTSLRAHLTVIVALKNVNLTRMRNGIVIAGKSAKIRFICVKLA